MQNIHHYILEKQKSKQTGFYEWINSMEKWRAVYGDLM